MACRAWISFGVWKATARGMWVCDLWPAPLTTIHSPWGSVFAINTMLALHSTFVLQSIYHRLARLIRSYPHHFLLFLIVPLGKHNTENHNCRLWTTLCGEVPDLRHITQHSLALSTALFALYADACLVLSCLILSRFSSSILYRRYLTINIPTAWNMVQNLSHLTIGFSVLRN